MSYTNFCTFCGTADCEHIPALNPYNVKIETMDYTALEQITDTRCAECGDKLAVWENTICCICEALAD